jgi:hypothetical protein
MLSADLELPPLSAKADLAELPPLNAKALCLFWIPRDAGETSASAPVMVQHEATSSSGSLTFIEVIALRDTSADAKIFAVKLSELRVGAAKNGRIATVGRNAKT